MMIITSILPRTMHLAFPLLTIFLAQDMSQGRKKVKVHICVFVMVYFDDEVYDVL